MTIEWVGRRIGDVLEFRRISYSASRAGYAIFQATLDAGITDADADPILTIAFKERGGPDPLIIAVASLVPLALIVGATVWCRRRNGRLTIPTTSLKSQWPSRNPAPDLKNKKSIINVSPSSQEYAQMQTLTQTQFHTGNSSLEHSRLLAIPGHLRIDLEHDLQVGVTLGTGGMGYVQAAVIRNPELSRRHGGILDCARSVPKERKITKASMISRFVFIVYCKCSALPA